MTDEQWVRALNPGVDPAWARSEFDRLQELPSDPETPDAVSPSGGHNDEAGEQ
jgi:hypothetical protein